MLSRIAGAAHAAEQSATLLPVPLVDSRSREEFHDLGYTPVPSPTEVFLMKQKLHALIIKYRHGWLLSYFALYLIWFSILEQNITSYHIIYSPLDDRIPFVEYFVIPYMMWFPYIGFIFVYLFLKNRHEFYQLCAFMYAGMTIFLVVSSLYPNGDLLRPSAFADSNFCVSIVKWLYSTDTPTNVLPSIHVFNSIGAYIAIARSEELGNKRPVRIGSLILSILIILSTMFIKQHSVIDVTSACVMACILYFVVYERGAVRVREPMLTKEER